jgi:hypothetical protein
MIPLLLSLTAFAAGEACDPWTDALVHEVQSRFVDPQVGTCRADVTARITTEGVLLTLDLPAGRRSEQCDEALLGAFRDVAISAPPFALLKNGVATVIVPLGVPAPDPQS